jgi:hypothetical protein
MSTFEVPIKRGILRCGFTPRQAIGFEGKIRGLSPTRWSVENLRMEHSEFPIDTLMPKVPKFASSQIQHWV